MTQAERINAAWWSLRLAFFLGPFLAGLDKFFHVLTNWDKYLSPVAQRVLGSYNHSFMLLVGVVEMIVGLMVISRWPRLGAYIACAWLALIAINLIIGGQYYDIALRDIGLCLSAYGLGRVSEARATAFGEASPSRASDERMAA